MPTFSQTTEHIGPKNEGSLKIAVWHSPAPGKPLAVIIQPRGGADHDPDQFAVRVYELGYSDFGNNTAWAYACMTRIDTFGDSGGWGMDLVLDVIWVFPDPAPRRSSARHEAPDAEPGAAADGGGM